MPTDRQLRLLLSLYSLVAAAMLLVAIGQQEYSYYVLLRWVVCFAAVVVTALSLRWRHVWAAGVFPFVALLFNPFVPVELSRVSWGVIDAGASILFLAVIPFLGFPNVTGRIGAKLWQWKIMLAGGLAAVAVVVAVLLLSNNNAPTSWRKELQAYRDIPSDTRDAYRTDNPEIDAKLFITGTGGVSRLQTGYAYKAVVRLMKENNIRVEDIRSREVKRGEPTCRTNLRNNLLRDVEGVGDDAPPRSQPTMSSYEWDERQKRRAAYGLPAEPTPEPTPSNEWDERQKRRAAYGLPAEPTPVDRELEQLMRCYGITQPTPEPVGAR